KKRKKSLENCPRISTENDDIIEKCETLCQMIGDLLDHFSLSKHSELLMHTIETMTELSRVADTKFDVELCYNVLSALTKDLHGEDNYSTILQQLFKNLECEKKLVNSTINWIISTMNQSEETVLVWMQHVCIKMCNQKISVRNVSCSSISTIYFALSSDQQSRFVAFLMKFARNQKSSHRLYAVECSLKILEDSLKTCTEENPISEGSSEEENIQSLLVILLSRTSDKAANVRSKALYSFVHVLQLA